MMTIISIIKKQDRNNAVKLWGSFQTKLANFPRVLPRQVDITLDTHGFCVHSLRATATTNALDHKADIAKVQEWLGQANVSTTRLYDKRNSRPERARVLRWSIKGWSPTIRLSENAFNSQSDRGLTKTADIYSHGIFFYSRWHSACPHKHTSPFCCFAQFSQQYLSPGFTGQLHRKLAQVEISLSAGLLDSVVISFSSEKI